MSSTPSAIHPGKTQPARRQEIPKNAESLLRETFDDIALVICGGAVAHGIDDDLTWTLTERLDRIRVRLLRDLKRIPLKDLFDPRFTWPPRVHPAIEAFLGRNQPEMGE
jgi:hypothetical protein